MSHQPMPLEKAVQHMLTLSVPGLSIHETESPVSFMLMPFQPGRKTLFDLAMRKYQSDFERSYSQGEGPIAHLKTQREEFCSTAEQLPHATDEDKISSDSYPFHIKPESPDYCYKAILTLENICPDESFIQLRYITENELPQLRATFSQREAIAVELAKKQGLTIIPSRLQPLFELLQKEMPPLEHNRGIYATTKERLHSLDQIDLFMELCLSYHQAINR